MSDILFIDSSGGVSVPAQFGELGNGVNARTVFEADGGYDPATDIILVEGDPYGAKIVRYRPASDETGYAKGVYISAGAEAIQTGDIVDVIGTTPILFKSMGDGTRAEVMFESDGLVTQSGDKVVMDGKVPVRYKAVGTGLFARTVVFSDGGEAAVGANDKIVPIGFRTLSGQATKFFRALGDGTYAEVLLKDGNVFGSETDPVDNALISGNLYIGLDDLTLVYES